MGGIFLLSQFFKLLLVFITGYLYIGLLPDFSSNSLSDIIVELVLSPINFLAASTAFIIGIVLQGNVLTIEIQSMIQLFKGDYTNNLILIPVNIILLGVLCYVGFYQAIVFIVTASFYGMISLDFRGRGGQNEL